MSVPVLRLLHGTLLTQDSLAPPMYLISLTLSIESPLSYHPPLPVCLGAATTFDQGSHVPRMCLSVSFCICLSLSPLYLLGRMPFGKLTLLPDGNRPREGDYIHFYIIGNARKEKNPRLPLWTGKKKSLSNFFFFLVIVPHVSGAMVRAKGQPPHTVSGNAIQ